MYQLLCHVNVPVPADTCVTRTADRTILDFVPGMKRTVVITIKYYDNLKDFGTISVPDYTFYDVVHFIYNFQPGRGNGGEVSRVRKRFYFTNPFTAYFTLDLHLIIIILQNCVCFKIIIMSACIREFQHQNVLGE